MIVVRAVCAFGLERLNDRHTMDRVCRMPPELKGVVDQEQCNRAASYTLAKGLFTRVEVCYDALLLLAVVFSGVLPWAWRTSVGWWGDTASSAAAFIFMVGLGFTVLSLPFRWYAQFLLEDRFGFNTSRPALWWSDRLKNACLSLVLAYPLLYCILKFVEWTEPWWWLWAWAAVMVVQFLLAVLGPTFIMPWFNRFSPLPAGALRDRLLALADRTGFRAGDIQIMDGSRRSRHLNAFFTGLGRMRRIVLFDTLVERLEEVEIESVLAHEIGHYRRHHVLKMLLASMSVLLGSFWLIGWLAHRDWFLAAFGFPPGHVPPALLICALLAPGLLFWTTPLLNFWSRAHEFEADAFAARTVGTAAPLVSALTKLHRHNLSNLTPHPLYSAFFYSHPSFFERRKALDTLRRDMKLETCNTRLEIK
jgi:STE24 endopeptidase